MTREIAGKVARAIYFKNKARGKAKENEEYNQGNYNVIVLTDLFKKLDIPVNNRTTFQRNKDYVKVILKTFKDNEIIKEFEEIKETKDKRTTRSFKFYV